MKIEVFELDQGEPGELLDTITTTLAGPKFATGKARGIWESVEANLDDPAKTPEVLSSWSNGYVASQRVTS